MSFKSDVKDGLSASQKYLPSQYFYDAEGDKLFQAIMQMPEYYLTRSEFEIFSTSAKEIFDELQVGTNSFDLVEFGAGDGTKTKILLERLLQTQANFKYIPIDISGDVLDGLKEDLNRRFPTLEVMPQNAEYFEALERIGKTTDRPKVILFLGSSIGNFLEERTLRFLGSLNDKLRQGDKTLIGFDLQKNPKIILDAYNDKQGITKAFNLNLLKRINQELNADFNLEAWDHFPFYDPESGFAKSYIISLKKQHVKVGEAGETYSFENGEVIHTEISRKYTIAQIEKLFTSTGFKVVKHFFDCKHYYVNTLAEKL